MQYFQAKMIWFLVLKEVYSIKLNGLFLPLPQVNALFNRFTKLSEQQFQMLVFLQQLQENHLNYN